MADQDNAYAVVLVKDTLRKFLQNDVTNEGINIIANEIIKDLQASGDVMLVRALRHNPKS